jgi:hypothetical protein
VQLLAVLHAQPRSGLLDLAIALTNAFPIRPPLFATPLFGTFLLTRSAIALGIPFLALAVGPVLLLGCPTLLLGSPLLFRTMLRLSASLRLSLVVGFRATIWLCPLPLGLGPPTGFRMLPRRFGTIAWFRTVPVRALQLTMRSSRATR